VIRRSVIAAVAAIVLLAGCGSSHTPGISAGPSPTPTFAPQGVTTTSEIAASDATKDGTMALVAGQVLTVTLHSTYWQFAAPSDPSVLVALGQPVFQVCANPPPFPGSGCGTVMQRYQARQAGKVVLTAGRNACGEAMRCRPDQATWQLTVTVR
jgi:hypothetical protein